MFSEHRPHLQPPPQRLDVVRQRREVEILAALLLGQPLVSLIQHGEDLFVAQAVLVARAGDLLLRVHQALIQSDPHLIHRLFAREILRASRWL